MDKQIEKNIYFYNSYIKARTCQKLKFLKATSARNWEVALFKIVDALDLRKTTLTLELDDRIQLYTFNKHFTLR